MCTEPQSNESKRPHEHLSIGTYQSDTQTNAKAHSLIFIKPAFTPKHRFQTIAAQGDIRISMMEYTIVGGKPARACKRRLLGVARHKQRAWR